MGHVRSTPDRRKNEESGYDVDKQDCGGEFFDSIRELCEVAVRLDIEAFSNAVVLHGYVAGEMCELQRRSASLRHLAQVVRGLPQTDGLLTEQQCAFGVLMIACDAVTRCTLVKLALIENCGHVQAWRVFIDTLSQHSALSCALNKCLMPHMRSLAPSALRQAARLPALSRLEPKSDSEAGVDFYSKLLHETSQEKEHKLREVSCAIARAALCMQLTGKQARDVQSWRAAYLRRMLRTDSPDRRTLAMLLDDIRWNGGGRISSAEEEAMLRRVVESDPRTKPLRRGMATTFSGYTMLRDEMEVSELARRLWRFALRKVREGSNDPGGNHELNELFQPDNTRTAVYYALRFEAERAYTQMWRWQLNTLSLDEFDREHCHLMVGTRLKELLTLLLHGEIDLDAPIDDGQKEQCIGLVSKSIALAFVDLLRSDVWPLVCHYLLHRRCEEMTFVPDACAGYFEGKTSMAEYTLCNAIVYAASRCPSFVFAENDTHLPADVDLCTMVTLVRRKLHRLSRELYLQETLELVRAFDATYKISHQLEQVVSMHVLSFVVGF